MNGAPARPEAGDKICVVGTGNILGTAPVRVGNVDETLPNAGAIVGVRPVVVVTVGTVNPGDIDGTIGCDRTSPRRTSARQMIDRNMMLTKL